MATQAVAGRIAFLGYAATSSGTAAEIAEVRNFTLNTEQAQIDASSNDSSGWNENLAGQRGWSAQFESVYARTDTEQVALRKSLSSGTVRYFQLRPSTAQNALWKGYAFVENYSIGGSYDNIVLFNMTLRGTRALTYTT